MELVQPSIAIASPAQVGPLPQHLEQIALARVRGRRVRRAATVATISGWSLAIFAGLTILSGLFDTSTLLAGVGIGLISHLELRGARDLRRLDVRAARRLAWNQILLGVIIVACAGFRMAQTVLGAGPLASASSDPQVSEMLGSFDNLARGIYTAFYGAIIFVGIVGPGSTALYYATRRKYIEEYLSHAPPWIVELNRKGISV